MKIGFIVQARTSSARLKEKVLLKLPYNSEITVLQQIIRRIKQSAFMGKGIIIIATTEDPLDDRIVDVAKKEGVSFFRGDCDNVLSRYYYAAIQHGVDTCVRITGDCPCLDYKVMDDLIRFHIEGGYDYCSNTLEKYFIHGVDAEVFSFAALKEAFENATEKFQLEHVTTYFYKYYPEQFKIGSFQGRPDNDSLKAPHIRATLDTKEDYVLISAIYDYLYEKNNFFESRDIIRLFSEKPWLLLINDQIVQKKVFLTMEEEIEEAVKVLEMQDIHRAAEILKEYKPSC